MKFCPYCGADLLKEDAVFCVECGAKLSGGEKREKTKKVNGGKYSKEKKKKQVKTAPVDDTPPVDDGYDGYYDDVLPPDLDREKEGLDKELIKKIVALGVGVVFIIGLCVVMMYVL